VHTDALHVGERIGVRRRSLASACAGNPRGKFCLLLRSRGG